MRCTHSGTGCNPQQEEKYTIQNTLHDCNDVQSFWRDEELSVNKLNCRLTQLTTDICMDVSRGVRSSQRCNQESAWMYFWRQAAAVMLYILQSYCSFTRIKCAGRERWEQHGPMMRGRVVSSLSLPEGMRSCCCLYCSSEENPLANDAMRIDDEIVNKTTSGKRETTKHDRLSEWVKETTPQLLYDYRCASALHQRNTTGKPLSI